MQQALEQLVYENVISIEDARSLFASFTSAITDKLPQLKQLIADVFENADADILEQHINRAVDLFQQKKLGKINCGYYHNSKPDLLGKQVAEIFFKLMLPSGITISQIGFAFLTTAPCLTTN